MQIINIKDQPQHISQLAQWHHQEWASLNPGRTLEQRIVYMQSYLSDKLVPSTFIAKGLELMGSAAITENDLETRPELTPWLASVFVAPKFRNRGIGSLLVRHVMQNAKDNGLKALYLFTPDRVSFYENLGWQTFNEEEYIEQKITIMRVTLADWEANAFPIGFLE